MGKVKIRYFVEKPGAAGPRYFWQPSATLASLGWAGCRLAAHKATAIAEAEKLNAELDAWRAGTGPVKGAPAPVAKAQPKTLAAVIAAYQQSRFWSDLRERTRRSYQQNIDFLEAWGGDKPVAAITPQTVETLYTSLYKATPSKAAAIVTMLRVLLAAALKQGLVTSNAAARAGIRGAKPSGRIWPREAVRLFMEAADVAGWHSVGTAVAINHWLGQREGDILALPRNAANDGRFRIHQSKTGARVSILDTPDLRARLAAERANQEALQEARQQALRRKGAINLPPPEAPATLLLCEATGQPWTEGHFRHVFADVRAALAKDHPTIAHPDGTQVATEKLWFMHLRHTAVTELAIAGVTALQITGITGHSIGSVNKILARYLSLTAELADQATAKRTAFEDERKAKENRNG